MTAKNKDIFNRMDALGKKGKPFVFVLDAAGREGFAGSWEEAAGEEIFFTMNQTANHRTFSCIPGPFHFRKFPLPFEIYDQAFRLVSQQIRYGNSYLLNLTFPTPVEISLSLREIYLRSQSRYKLLYQNKFVVFSPETFVSIRGDRIQSFPMKGTIDANVPDAEKRILSDAKETAEHYTIVDLIRNDLSMVATGISVDQFRYVEKIRTNQKDLLQVSSSISGRLPADWRRHIGSLFRTILPAGSVTGAPKAKTVEIIRSVEPGDRGFYTGILGVFDGENLDSAVLIRFIEQQDEGMVFRSGGGITSLSEAEEEYREMIDKVYVPIV